MRMTTESLVREVLGGAFVSIGRYGPYRVMVTYCQLKADGSRKYDSLEVAAAPHLPWTQRALDLYLAGMVAGAAVSAGVIRKEEGMKMKNEDVPFVGFDDTKQQEAFDTLGKVVGQAVHTLVSHPLGPSPEKVFSWLHRAVAAMRGEEVANVVTNVTSKLYEEARKKAEE
ncbi:MAG: hypothetical protein ABIH41_01420 [Nanoarchaeota archaeon]